MVSTLFAINNSPARAANSACFKGTAFAQLFFYIPMTLVPGDQVTASITSDVAGDTVNIFAVALSYFVPTTMQASPMTYTFPDVSVTENSTYRLDFWDYASRPVNTKSFTYTVSINGGCGLGGALFFDGRLNSRDGNESFAVYCMADGSVKVLSIAQSQGFDAFIATAAEIAKVPKYPVKNTAIKSGNGATLYRLTSGELQINRLEQGGTGKDYKFIFSDCPVG